jgi:hypothetical protein
VTIRLEAAGEGTRLDLRHEFAESAVRDEHVQGWRYQLSVFGNVVADLVNVNASNLVDAWFAAWSESNPAAREAQLAGIATADVTFRDRFGLLDGIADLVPHIGATQHFMPDLRFERQGDVRHCQGMVLADWVARAGDGRERGSGTNVFILRGGRIASVTGFWGPQIRSTSE